MSKFRLFRRGANGRFQTLLSMEWKIGAHNDWRLFTMKVMASALIGASLLAAASIGLSEPAAARTVVGAYVGPGGVGISVDTYRRYCRDEYYRRNHWSNCARFYGGGAYYPNAYYRHHHHRHWNAYRRRWDWD
jgi:hypothetical protein